MINRILIADYADKTNYTDLKIFSKKTLISVIRIIRVICD